MLMSTDVVLSRANLSVWPCTIARREFAMKYNPYDDEQVGERRIGRPPLPADAIYRRQQQHGEMFDELDDLEPITPNPPKQPKP
jgi:hypothetical protein